MARTPRFPTASASDTFPADDLYGPHDKLASIRGAAARDCRERNFLDDVRREFFFYSSYLEMLNNPLRRTLRRAKRKYVRGEKIIAVQLVVTYVARGRKFYGKTVVSWRT